MESDNADDTALQQCETFLRQKDAVMEPKVWDMVVGYIQAGGAAETVVETLTENYAGYAQMASLVCKWLQLLEAGGDPPSSNVSTSSSSLDPFHFLQQLIKQKFNADKFAGLFAKGGSGPPAWLDELINDRRGRQLVYELSAQHENCLLFNFAIQKILYQGYEDELALMGSSLASYFGVYHRLLAAKLKQATRASPADFESLCEELHQSCGNSQHTYCHAQQLLMELSGLPNGHMFERMSQELESATAHQHPAAWRMRTFFLPPSAPDTQHQATQLVGRILADSPPLRLSDVKSLARMYRRPPCPSLSPLRRPQLLRLLTSHAFSIAPGGNKELREMCCDLLALAAAGDETTSLESLTPPPDDTAPPPSPSPHSLPHTRNALHQALLLLAGLAPGSNPLDEAAASAAVAAPAACCGLLHYMRASVAGRELVLEGGEGCRGLGKAYLRLLQMIGEAHTHLQLQVLDLVLSVLCTLSSSPSGGRMTSSVKRWVELLLPPLESGWVLETLDAVLARSDNLPKPVLAHFVSLLAARAAPPFSQEFSSRCMKLLRKFGGVRQDPAFSGYNRTLLAEFGAACNAGATQQ